MTPLLHRGIGIKHLIVILVGFAALSGSRTQAEAARSVFANVHSYVADSEDAAFPDDFQFGASTAAFQIEGAWDTDGKSPSIWDDMVHEHPELIAHNDSADVAADSYHLYEDDIVALKAVEVNVYRFSIAWTRILPDCVNPNPRGIRYYNRLIDRLLAEGIEPLVTMFHYDLPRCVQKIGGWTNPLVQDYFEAYADVLFQSYGDRVKRWITVNEPYEFCVNGYGSGEEAPLVPGFDMGAEYLCADNVLKTHARVYHHYQELYAKQYAGKIGITLNSGFFYAEEPNAADATDLVDRAMQFQLGWFAHAIFSPSADYYPPVVVETVASNSVREGRLWSRLPKWSKEWKAKIHGSADFLGLNYYSSRLVRMANESVASGSMFRRTTQRSSINNDINLIKTVNDSWVRGQSSWLYSVPAGLGDLLRWIRDEYDNPEVVITENGWSDDGRLNDTGRVAYLRDHLREVLRAVVQDGCNVSGYTTWSIIDNFEWTDGFGCKFGMYAVDLDSPTKTRTPKLSADYFKRVVQSRRVPDE